MVLGSVLVPISNSPSDGPEITSEHIVGDTGEQLEGVDKDPSVWFRCRFHWRYSGSHTGGVFTTISTHKAQENTRRLRARTIGEVMLQRRMNVLLSLIYTRSSLEQGCQTPFGLGVMYRLI